MPYPSLGKIVPYTWATKPSATLNSGTEVFITDVGNNGSKWRSNGTIYVPTAPVTLYRLTSPTTTSNGTAEELIAITGKIPNGVLQPGFSLVCNMFLTKSSTSESTSNTIKIGTNSNGITSATPLSSSLSVSTTSRQFSFTQLNTIIDATHVQQGVQGGSANPFGIGTSTTFAQRTITSIVNDLYISITGTKTTGGIETISCPYFEVILYP